MTIASPPGADPDDIARRAADVMWADDAASRGLGMALVGIGPGLAIISMAITAAMVNGHGLAHGGFIFTLADSAFAFACNSHGQRHVAQQCHVTFVAPGRLGMVLTAEARERHRAGRSGIYDVTVRDETGTVIAEFRGHSRAIAGALVASSLV